MKGRDVLRFHRPVVWVTGASSGIGREIARQFARVGCEVCLSSRSAPRLKSAVREITNEGGKAHSFPCDVSDPRAVARTASRIKKGVGPVEILVNNAGITVFKTFLRTTVQEFDRIVATNLMGSIACIKAVLPSMVKRRRGWVINIISNAAVKTFEGATAYTATKAGMLGFARVLREEMRTHKVKVVNILPGATETDMWSPAARRKFSSRMMQARSVAESVLVAYQMPDDVVPDEIVLRPIRGDID